MKPKGATPTQRTLQECRKRGWTACVVEKWIPQTRRRLDAFGFGDVLVVDGQQGALLIQATGDSGGNVSGRVTKITTECADAARAWIAAGNRIEVWGWGKRGAAGSRKLWTLRVVPVASVPELVVGTLLGAPVLASSLSNELVPDYHERVGRACRSD